MMDPSPQPDGVKLLRTSECDCGWSTSTKGKGQVQQQDQSIDKGAQSDGCATPSVVDSSSTCVKTRRMPCMARGMDNSSHNAATAYFDIPVDAPHGLFLTCSHAECNEAGCKFRFCQVCCIPVTKRNFFRRHGHGKVSRSNGHSTNQSDKSRSASFTVTTMSQTPCPRAPLRRQVSISTLSSFAATENEHKRQRLSPTEEMTSIVSDEEKEWIALLRERPTNDPMSLSHWLDKVISCKSNTTGGIVIACSPKTSSPLASGVMLEPPTRPPGPLCKPVFPTEMYQYGGKTSSAGTDDPGFHCVLGKTRINSDDFAAAVNGIDFAKIFD